MKKDTTKTPADMADEKLFDNWFDPIETALRTKVRGLIETQIRRASCAPAPNHDGSPVETNRRAD